MPTLQELQAFDREQSKAPLQTLLLEFSATLARLPSLQRELQSWLAQNAQAVDYNALAARAETALVMATDWLLEYDLLKPDIKQSISMQEFMRTVAETVTCRTVAGVVQKFKSLPNEIKNALEQAAREEKQKQIAEEEKRKVAEKAEKEKQAAEKAKRIEPTMVLLPAGTFQMGGDDKNALSNEKPLHPVRIQRFEIGKYPITQGEWKAVMGNNPSFFTGDDNLPVENVNWYDAQEYIEKLNRLTGKNYRLPSESEWEYTCRGGGRHIYSGSDEAYLVAWFDQNSGKKTHPVGQKQPNGFGLYDMSGNVWEWVQDWYHDNYNGAPDDGSAWIAGGEQTYRVLRGGSWYVKSNFTRAAFRNIISPDIRSNVSGFRVARTVS